MPYVHENGLTVYYVGEPEVETQSFKSKYGEVQSYEAIIATYSPSLNYKDPEFPADLTSVGSLDLLDSASPSARNLKANGWNGTVEWMRVSDYVNAKSEALGAVQGDPTPSDWEGARPAFIVDGLSRMDVNQGLVGDCWYVSALSEVVMEAELASFVIPEDNKNNNGSGAYHVRLYHNGLWLDVVVDDYIPVVRLSYGIVQTLGSGIPLKDGQAELWTAIAEKAYAKINGSYSNLAGNQPRYAFQALTGGIGEKVNFTTDTVPPNLYEYIQATLAKRAFVVVWTAGPRNKAEGQSLGIQYDHAYAVTAVSVVDYLGSKVKLVRLRNPHGKDEFTGRWSDQNIDGPYRVPGLSKEWKYVPQAQKDALGLVVKNEGEFWIQLEDVLKFFYQVDLCYWAAPSELSGASAKVGFYTFQGTWSQADNTAGGQYDIANNPQYIVDVGADATGAQSALVIDLAYKALSVKSAAPVLGINVYPIKDKTQTTPLPASFFYTTRALPAPKEGKALVGGVLSNAIGYVVPAGRYLIVPYLYKQFQFGEITEGEFCLRAITRKQ